MMEQDLPELYELETVEQIRALADELRQRIMDALLRRAMTVTQAGEQLGIAPAKVHYHVRELERVGLVKLVETREKGGILEKYYRPVARSILVPPSLLRMAPDENLAAINQLIQDAARGFTRALERRIHLEGEEPESFSLSRSHIWVTPDELKSFHQQLQQLLEQYENPRGVEGEYEHSFVQVSYPTRLSVEDVEEAPVAESQPPKWERTVMAGVLEYGRRDLESAIERNGVLDMISLGTLTFADDVSPELADRAIARLRHRGPLRAQPQVLEVLRRKQAVT